MDNVEGMSHLELQANGSEIKLKRENKFRSTGMCTLMTCINGWIYMNFHLTLPDSGLHLDIEGRARVGSQGSMLSTKGSC